MKWYSPFLAFIFFLAFGCNNKPKHSDDNKEEDAIGQYIDKAFNDKLPAADRFMALDKAAVLAKGNKGKEYLVASNRLHIIVSQFRDSMPAAKKLLRKIEADSVDNVHQPYYQTCVADYMFSERKYDSAFFYYNKAKTGSIEQKDSIRAGYCLIMMAEIWQVFNEYNESETDAVEALKLVKPSKNKEYLAEIYNTLGIADISLKRYSAAINNYKDALQLVTSDLHKQILNNNIGHAYMLDKKYDAAITIFRKLLTTPTVLNDASLHARVLDNLGYALLHKDLSGETEMLSSLEIRIVLQETNEIATSCIHLHDYYFRHGALTKAIRYARMALSSATTVSATDDRLTAIAAIAALTNGLEEKELSMQHRQLSDSIGDVRKMMTDKFAKTKYDYELAIAYAAVMKRNVALEKKTKMIVFYCGVFLILSVVVFFIYKSKKEKQLTAYKAETRIAKRIHDELANDVFYTMAFAENENLSDTENKETLLHNLDNIYSRTRDISRDLNTIDTGPEFPQQLRELMSGYQSSNVKIITVGLDAVFWNKIAIPKKIVLYRVVQEWLTNMKKHSKSTKVLLTFKTDNGRITVDYSDDGVGLPDETTAAKKMLADTENRIKLVNGKYTFTTSERGLKVSLSIPL